MFNSGTIGYLAGMQVVVIPSRPVYKKPTWVEKVLRWNPCNDFHKQNVEHEQFAYRSTFGNVLYVTPGILTDLRMAV